MHASESICTGPDRVDLVTLSTPGLGNRSYLAIADGWAVGVDIQRDIDRVRHILDDRGLGLAAVVETHIHNDYVTGGFALARERAAEYVVPAGPTLSFEVRQVVDAETIHVGPVALRVIASPGHTDAHVTYALHVGDTPAAAAFTGGSLLLAGTGRTDLLGRDRAARLAVEQYWSARRLARLLPPEARILPTHGFGSYCVAGQAAAAATDRLAEQLDINPVFLLDEEAFVEHTLGGLGPIPAYYPKMAPRNAAGPLASDLVTPPLIPAAIAARRAIAGGTVVDVRPRTDHARGHIPGSLCVDATGAVATWTGWLADIDAPLTVIASDQGQLAYVQRELSRIGFDRLAGAVLGDLSDSGVQLTSQQTSTFADLAGQPDPVRLVDVRDPAEWEAGHPRGAIHAPVYEILDSQLPDRPWLYCGMGFRASIAGSLLARSGRDSVVIDDSVTAAHINGVPWCDARECTARRCRATALTTPA